MKSDADVLIIGAGAAGLAAAAELARSGRRVRIVEARERIGGRIFTRTDQNSGQAVELGAEFIHGKPPEIWELLAAHPVPVDESAGEDWCVEHGQAGPCEFFEPVEELLARMPRCSDPDRSFLQFLRECGGDADERTRRRATGYVSGFNAADPGEISVRSLVQQREADERIDGDRAFRPRAGYQAVVQALRAEAAEPCPIDLGAVVRRVRWRRGAVTVEAVRNGEPAQYSAPRAIITVPLGVLQANPGSDGAIEFEPALDAKRDALSKLRMGPVIRVTLGFSERFWAEPQAGPRSLADLRFLFTDDEAFPTWWTLAPRTAPILTGWAPAEMARRLSGMPEQAMVEEALEALARQLPLDRRRLDRLVLSAWVHDWQADPFSRGAYSYACVGGADAPARLAAPLDDTLFFAGEATDTGGHAGTVHGAIASGRRAARQIARTGE